MASANWAKTFSVIMPMKIGIHPKPVGQPIVPLWSPTFAVMTKRVIWSQLLWLRPYRTSHSTLGNGSTCPACGWRNLETLKPLTDKHVMVSYWHGYDGGSWPILTG